jgi:hypothetical protein
MDDAEGADEDEPIDSAEAPKTAPVVKEAQAKTTEKTPSAPEPSNSRAALRSRERRLQMTSEELNVARREEKAKRKAAKKAKGALAPIADSKVTKSNDKPAEDKNTQMIAEKAAIAALRAVTKAGSAKTDTDKTTTVALPKPVSFFQ